MNRNVQYRLAWPPVSKSVIALAVALFALWFASLTETVGAFAHDHLMLSAANIMRDYEIWTFLTYGAFETDFFGVLFAAFAVWVFGGELERSWGTLKWWLVQIVAVVAGGLLTFAILWLVGSVLVIRGYHGAVMALVTAYCWRHWRTPQHFFFFEMTGRTMLALFLGLGILLAAFSGFWPVIALDVAGVAVGFIASGRTFNPRDLRVRFRNWRIRRKISVVPKSPESGKANGKKNGKSNGVHLN